MSEKETISRLRHLCRVHEGLAPVIRELVACHKAGDYSDYDYQSLLLSRKVRELSAVVRVLRAEARTKGIETAPARSEVE